jgi:hypothetical protein
LGLMTMAKAEKWREEVWTVKTAEECGCHYQTFPYHVHDAAGRCRVVCTHLRSVLKHAGRRYLKESRDGNSTRQRDA